MKRQQNIYSHLTAKDRKYLSLPALFLFQQNLLQGKILDFGCGLGNDVRELQQKGFDIVGYDPHYFPNYIPEYSQQKFDTIICIYVLNVLFPEEQAQVIMEISSRLKAGGKAYFAVRRDIKKEGFRQHYIHQKPTYQCQVKLPFKSIQTHEYFEIYEYIHYNQQRHSNHHCIFCNPPKNLTILTESATAYAILDKYPVSKGHTLVIPKRHIQNYFDLPQKEQSACWLMVNKIQEILTQTHQPDGFNIGMNINRAAGQNVMHASIHIIPRYNGDGKGKSGIRCVLGSC